jgi:hypothetical protein
MRAINLERVLELPDVFTARMRFGDGRQMSVDIELLEVRQSFDMYHERPVLPISFRSQRLAGIKYDRGLYELGHT